MAPMIMSVKPTTLAAHVWISSRCNLLQGKFHIRRLNQEGNKIKIQWWLGTFQKSAINSLMCTISETKLRELEISAMSGFWSWFNLNVRLFQNNRGADCILAWGTFHQFTLEKRFQELLWPQRGTYRSLSDRKMRPKIIWPASCPHPQRAPTEKLCSLDRPIQSGASAARWSGPVNVCRPPAINPVQALASNLPPPRPNSLDRTPLLLAATSPPTNVWVSTAAVARPGGLLSTIRTPSTTADRILATLKSC
jgi:hypothetical protein